MNNLVRDTAYIHYAANKARVQNAMKRLDESGNVLTEEQINQIIMEEFNATEILNKIKQVFTNMTNKFVDFTKKQIQNKHDEAYLKAIQPKVAEVAKSKNIPLEMLPYDQGIKNIEGAPNNIFGKLIDIFNYKSIIKYFDSNNIPYIYLGKNKVVVHN